MQQPTSPDVIVVGGGVIGCAAAYFLGARHGLHCVVLERDAIGSQASGGAAGELSPTQNELPYAFYEFGAEGLRLHREMATTLVDESGIDYHLTNTPIYYPAFTGEEVERRQRDVRERRAAGRSAAWLGSADLRDRGTLLPDGVLGAAYAGDEYQLETYRFALALAGAAERHGATIQTREVTGVTGKGLRATGVRFRDGRLESDAVVLAAGPWSQSVGDWIGLEVPVEPVRGQIVHLRWRSPHPPPEYAIFHSSGYVLPKPLGRIYTGTTYEYAGFDRQPTAGARESIMRGALRLVPALEEAEEIEMTACLRPVSRDGMPIIGAAPGWEGLYLATGHGRKGILMCLATGKHLADLVATGRSEYPLEPFSPQRLVRERSG